MNRFYYVKYTILHRKAFRKVEKNYLERIACEGIYMI